jgi:hypothetical protein
VSFDPVPLVLGGGAVHTDDVFRSGINAFTRDAQGIVLPGNMKVTALGSPGAAVNIATGAVVIREPALPGQSYVGRVGSVTQHPVAPQGAGTRSELIIARVRNPEVAPWTPYTLPADIANGPYFEPWTVPCSSSTTAADQVVSYAAEALARIDMPSGASFVGAGGGTVVDLRSLAQPRIWNEHKLVTGPDPTQDVTTSETAWMQFPTISFTVKVPRWATHCDGSITLSNILTSTLVVMETRIVVGSITGSDVFVMDNDTSSGGYEQMQHITGFDENVSALQGQTVVIQLQARRTWETVGTGIIQFGSWGQMEFNFNFRERVV